MLSDFSSDPAYAIVGYSIYFTSLLPAAHSGAYLLCRAIKCSALSRNIHIIVFYCARHAS